MADSAGPGCAAGPPLLRPETPNKIQHEATVGLSMIRSGAFGFLIGKPKR